jgi:predicted permease
MKRLLQLYRRLRFYFRRGRFDRELEAEIGFHLDMKARAKISAGAGASEALRAARRHFGNVTALQERSREMWTFRWIEELSQDLRYSVRIIRKSPVLAAVVAASLALAIGANTAVFSLVDATLLKMLPVSSPGDLVLFGWNCGPNAPVHSLNGSMSTDPTTGLTVSTSFSGLQFERMSSENPSLTGLFAYAPAGALDVVADGSADIASGQVVSSRYFEVLGVRALAGRVLTSEDDRPAAEPVAVISYRYWKRRFSIAGDAVGKTININAVPFTIVGVTPLGFEGTMGPGYMPEVTIPMAMDARVSHRTAVNREPWNWWLRVMGRLKPGVTFDQARSNLEGAFQQAALEGHQAFIAKSRTAGGDIDTPRLTAVSGSHGLDDFRSIYSQELGMLMIVVALVLLIACANTANLLLSRAAARRKEIAVRMGLGARRARLVRQLLTESMVLAMAGGIGGGVLAYWGRNTLLALVLQGTPAALDARLDLRVLGFTAGVSLLTGILFGIAPAFRATRLELSPALKESVSDNSKGRFGLPLGKALLVLQVAASFVLLISAGLFLRSLENLGRVNYGFDAKNLLLFKVDPTLVGYKGAAVAGLYDQILERIEATAGVRSVTTSSNPLIGGSASVTGGLIVPDSALPPDNRTRIYQLQVRGNFLDAMSIPVILGRSLSLKDDANAPKVAVVNQAFGKLYFADGNPVGKRFKFGEDDPRGYIEIVGMAGDAKYSTLRKEAPPTVYTPYVQNPGDLRRGMTFEVRAAMDPASLAPLLREAVLSVDGNLALSDVRTQLEQIDQSIAADRLFAGFTSAFAALALLLACLGLYGVASYGVSRRTVEIGVRMAIGADARSVLVLVMRETMLLVLIGAGLGVGVSLAASRLVASMVFGLTPNDPLTIGLAGLTVISVATLSGYLPARRASRIEPTRALRYE